MICSNRLLIFIKKNQTEFLVVFLYTLITASIFFNLLKNIGHALVDGDGLFTYWVLNWDINSYLHDPLNLFNTNIFYPNKNTLAYSEGFFIPALLALPFYLISSNMIFANNILIIFSYILAAFGAYKLSYYYTKSNYASFVAGLIFGFSTFRIVSIGHLQNIMTFWMPFAILQLQKYLDTFKRKHIIYFMLLFSAQVLSSWNMGAFFALFVTFFLVANSKLLWSKYSISFRDAIIVLVIAIIIIGPFAYPYLKLHIKTDFSYPTWEIVNGSADIGGYVLPVPGSFESNLINIFGIKKKHWSENFNFLGYFSILLLFWYFLFSKKLIKEKSFKIFSAGIPIFILLSFGPILRFLPGLRIPSLYYILTPVLGFVRTPSRLSIIVLLCVSIVTSYILSLFNFKSLVSKIIFFIAISSFILFEFWISPSQLFLNTACSDIYLKIKNDRMIKSVVELPIHEKPDGALNYVFRSACHLKPIFNGYSGYFPADYGILSESLRLFPSYESIAQLKSLKLNVILLHLADYDRENQELLLRAVKENDSLDISYQSGSDYLITLNYETLQSSHDGVE